MGNESIHSMKEMILSKIGRIKFAAVSSEKPIQIAISTNDKFGVY